MKTLGAQAEEFRTARVWTTAQMGQAVGTSRQNIESLEKSGNRIPKYIGALALAMGMSVDEMLVTAELAPRKLLELRRLPPTEWPFKIVDRSAYELLDEVEKGAVQNEMMRAIAGFLSKRHGGGPGKSSGPSKPAESPRKAA